MHFSRQSLTLLFLVTVQLHAFFGVSFSKSIDSATLVSFGGFEKIDSIALIDKAERLVGRDYSRYYRFAVAAMDDSLFTGPWTRGPLDSAATSQLRLLRGSRAHPTGIPPLQDLASERCWVLLRHREREGVLYKVTALLYDRKRCELYYMVSKW